MTSTARGALYGGLVRLVFVCGLVLAVAAAARAQSGDDLFTHYYQDPQPDRLVGYLAGIDSEDWRSYPPLAGFLAIVFKANPEAVERLLPDQPSPKMAAALAAALQLSGNGARIPSLIERDGQLYNEKLLVEFADLPADLDEVEIRTATHLDILWGAASASGDPRYPGMILEFMAATANQSEAIAADMAGIVLAMKGGPKEPMESLRDKYGDADGYRIIVASAALWGLQSNARRHDFVETLVRGYVDEHPNDFASKAISVFVQSR